MDAANQSKLDNFISDMKIKQQNQYLLAIRAVLLDKGWKKLPKDSIWFHPDYGMWHVLFAYYLATTHREQPDTMCRVAMFIAGILFGVGTTAIILGVF